MIVFDFDDFFLSSFLANYLIFSFNLAFCKSIGAGATKSHTIRRF